jgi:hypothetical protein
MRIIFQGDKVSLFAIDLSIDQLRMTATDLAGHYEGTLADKVAVDAVIALRARVNSSEPSAAFLLYARTAFATGESLPPSLEDSGNLISLGRYASL